MKVKQAIAVFDAFASALEEASCRSSAVELRAFSAALGGNGSLNVEVLVRLVRENYQKSSDVPLYPAALKARIQSIVQILQATGAKQAEALKTFLELFEGRSATDSDAFIEVVAAAKPAKSLKKRRKVRLIRASGKAT